MLQYHSIANQLHTYMAYENMHMKYEISVWIFHKNVGFDLAL